MDSLERAPRAGRETRLLVVTIVVSIGVLFLLARFRFPEQAAEAPATAAAAPLERLAARAVYDELASTMADLERRLADRIVVLPLQPPRESGGFIVAPRLTPDRAAALLVTGETLAGDPQHTTRIIARALAGDVSIIAVRADADAIVTPRSGARRPGPRYVVAVEGTADGLTLRPVYVGRTTALQEARTGTPLLSLTGVQHAIPIGAALFSLEGTFIGMVRESGATLTVLPGDVLRQAAEFAAASGAAGGHLGLTIEPMTAALARASGAERGVIVADVLTRGPAAGVVEPADVIQAIDGTPVTNVGEFRAAERTKKPGQDVVLSVLRRRAAARLTVRAADPRLLAGGGTPEEPGFIARAIPDAGLELVSVERESAAARADLLRGDLIVTIDGRPAREAVDFTRTFRSAPAGTAWLLTIQRGAQHRVVALEKR